MKPTAPDYSLLDSGHGRKLEQAGSVRLVRPAPNAFWKPALPPEEWEKANAVFTRDPGGGGAWQWKKGYVPGLEISGWTVQWGGLQLQLRPTRFGHLGFFAEQAENWQCLRQCIRDMKNPRTLNLFAYSGGASLAMAQAGAEVCHLDASKGIIEWAKKNQALNPETEGKIRWICDDAMKFLAREARRKSLYQGIVLDPPSFGRGAQGQVWKIESGIAGILENCRKILDLSGAWFILLSCHSPGFSAASLGRCLAEVFPGFENRLTAGEMLIPESTGKRLPAGLSAGIFNL